MYLINGKLRCDCDLDSALQQLYPQLPNRLQTPLETSTLLTAAQAFAERLQHQSLELSLDTSQRQALIDFCQPATLQAKLIMSWACDPIPAPHRLSAVAFRALEPSGTGGSHHAGQRAAVGVLCSPGRSVERQRQLAAPSSSDGGLTARLLQKLLECDPSGQLDGYVAVLPTTTGQIGQLCRHADGVSAWGGETALQAIRLQIPPGCRWIDWGHRISFAYLTPDAASPAVLDAIADEVCRLDQQACSSRNGCWSTATMRAY
jgi:phenylacetate-CoA ligase